MCEDSVFDECFPLSEEAVGPDCLEDDTEDWCSDECFPLSEVDGPACLEDCSGLCEEVSDSCND